MNSDIFLETFYPCWKHAKKQCFNCFHISVFLIFLKLCGHWLFFFLFVPLHKVQHFITSACLCFNKRSLFNFIPPRLQQQSNAAFERNQQQCIFVLQTRTENTCEVEPIPADWTGLDSSAVNRWAHRYKYIHIKQKISTFLFKKILS